MASITILNRSITGLANKLEKKYGVTTQLYVFKSGRYAELGASYVQLEIENNGELIDWYKFLANDYDSVGDKRVYGGRSIAGMKKLFYIDFDKDMKR